MSDGRSSVDDVIGLAIGCGDLVLKAVAVILVVGVIIFVLMSLPR